MTSLNKEGQHAGEGAGFDSPATLVEASRTKTAVPNSQPLSPFHLLNLLRQEGWMVAVHNDYRQNGKTKTFWLLTQGNVCLKGEGDSDFEALKAIWSDNSGADVTLPPAEHSTEPQANYVSVVQPNEHPSCRVCGAEMTPIGYECKSCGASTLPSESQTRFAEPQSPTEDQVRQARAQEWLLEFINAHRAQQDRLQTWEDIQEDALLYGFPVPELLVAYGAEQEQWWKGHAVVLLDDEKKELRCYLKGERGDKHSMCQGIEAENERLKQQLAQAERNHLKELVEMGRQAHAEERQRCAGIARTLLTNQGDQYGTCMIPSPDGERIAQAIEAGTEGESDGPDQRSNVQGDRQTQAPGGGAVARWQSESDAGD